MATKDILTGPRQVKTTFLVQCSEWTLSFLSLLVLVSFSIA